MLPLRSYHIPLLSYLPLSFIWNIHNHARNFFCGCRTNKLHVGTSWRFFFHFFSFSLFLIKIFFHRNITCSFFSLNLFLWFIFQFFSLIFLWVRNFFKNIFYFFETLQIIWICNATVNMIYSSTWSTVV